MIRANWKWTNDIEAEILQELDGVKGRIAHICSASSGIGDIRLDRWASLDYKDQRKIFGQPNICGDMCYLPIKSGIAAATICDPPYSPTRQGKHFPGLINELVRITAPQGKIIFVCPWILQHKAIEPKSVWLRPAGIDKGAFPSYKILSISIKRNGQLGDYE